MALVLEIIVKCANQMTAVVFESVIDSLPSQISFKVLTSLVFLNDQGISCNATSVILMTICNLNLYRWYIVDVTYYYQILIIIFMLQEKFSGLPKAS